MTVLSEAIHGDDHDRRYDTPTLAGSGGWARIAQVHADAGTLTATVQDFDAGTLTFGPVPYWARSDDPPAVGGSAWLLVDSAGQPGLALVY